MPLFGARPRCSLCKREPLVIKIRTKAGRMVTAIFCPRCDDYQEAKK